MPRPEWGVKRICTNCRARFYDLQRDPVVCPKCGTELNLSESVKLKRAPGARSAARPETRSEDEELVYDEADETEAEEEAEEAEEAEDVPLAAEDEADEEEVPAPKKGKSEEEEEFEDLEEDVLLEEEDDDDDNDLDDLDDLDDDDDLKNV